MSTRGMATTGIFPRARQVYDVTGAGDTSSGPWRWPFRPAPAYGSGHPRESEAAGVVVGMVGTATVTAAQLTGCPGTELR